MKNQLLTLLNCGALLLLLAFSAAAQTSPKRITCGIRFGANFTKLGELSYQTPRLGTDGLPVLSGGNVVYDFFQQNDSHSTGLVGGVFARFGNKLFVQPELLFSMKGGKIDLIRQGLATRSFDAKVGTIDLPLLLGVRLGPLRLNAGPMASLRVVDGDLKNALREYTSQSVRQTVRQTQFGYQAGIGLTFGGMQLDLRREGGLAKTSSPTTERDAQSGLSPRSSLWQLTVGFGF